MKKHLLLILIALVASQYLFSQNSTSTLEKLIDKEWRMVFPGEKQYTSSLFFSKKIHTSVLIYLGSEAKVFSTYYLSDNIDSTFNENSVGKVFDGKYIIKKSEEGEISVLEILEISKNKLKLKNLNNSSILDYKAIGFKKIKF